MNSVLRMSRNFWVQVIFIVLMPAFFIGFCFLYDPFSIQEVLVMGGKSFAFHIMMLVSIMLVSYAILRTAFFFIFRALSMNWWCYALWCIGEVFVTTCFMAMYVALFAGPELPFFTALALMMKLTYLSLIYPYVFVSMLQIIGNKDHELAEKFASPEESLIKFHDENQKLKLTIDPNAILYISAEANYMNIHYMEMDKLKEFMLRNSMKKMESYLSSHGLIRCQRSYFINPRHVKMLRRNKDGIIVAELTNPDITPIPVSKQYYEYLSSLL